MKSPEELAAKLARQWGNDDLRENRLLNGDSGWPVVLSIGKPSAGLLTTNLDLFKQHLERWRNVTAGTIVHERIVYRAAAEPVEIPVRWELTEPTEWVKATQNRTVAAEFGSLRQLIKCTDEMFHGLLVRRRSLWRRRNLDEVIQTCKLALELEPRSARGKPLRALSLAGIDTKFIERNKRLLVALLDTRFDGEVTEIGLENFLDAAMEGDHWLLVVDLDGHLLPYRRQRLAASDLQTTPLPARRILIVENESSLHQLPTLDHTIAILGAGLDLSWTRSDWLCDKHVGYWGDIDTWGLQCLAKAREALPHLQALMMTREQFDAGVRATVVEPVPAGEIPPQALTDAERTLYEYLLGIPKGRLEQEFVSDELVHEALHAWGNG